jgi:dTDP-4-dehydrorhamnose 3,5-epimerase
MTVLEQPPLRGVQLLRPQRHLDDRGWFLEILREDAVGDLFVQANHSHSRAAVLRGLRYHRRQADAWYVISGRARVGLADLRTKEKPKVVTIDLAGDDPTVLYIPPGIAHGFLALAELDLIYLVTHYYDASDEFSVAWNDPALAVPWGVRDPILSDRDREAAPLDWSEVASILEGPALPA